MRPPATLRVFMPTIASCVMLIGVCGIHSAESLNWKALSSEPPEGLLDAAERKSESVFTVTRAFPGTGLSQSLGGFFVAPNGVGVCPLKVFCEPNSLEFRAYDGTVLKQPNVLAVMGDAELVFLKFSHQPAAWIEFSSAKAQPGSWVAILSANKKNKPILGPVMSYGPRGDSGMTRKDKRDRYEGFLVVAPGNLGILSGTPLLDREGKVVGLYEGTPAGPGTTAMSARLARPVAGIELSLEAIDLRREFIGIPIPAELHPYDPAAVDPLSVKAQAAFATGDWKMVIHLCEQLVRKYPDSPYARSTEYMFGKQSPAGTMSSEKLAELSRRLVLDEAGPLTRSFMHVERGEAALRVRDQKTAEAEFKMAIELAPDGAGLSYANLGAMALTAKRLEEAERHYRKAVEMEPERIDYLDELRGILDRTGRWDESDDLSKRVFILERLYSRR